MTPRLSIIIPVLNEGQILAEKLRLLQPLREHCQLLLVDGGSDDECILSVETLVDQILYSPPGRAKQMNMGAAQADAAVLLFLHADTYLPNNAVNHILQAINNGYDWGRFDVCFDSSQCIFRLIAGMMNVRSRLTGIATGDQALFITRDVFWRAGGFPDIPLMEDITLCRYLKKIGKPACLRAKVITSARRWQHYGIVNTILLMWRLRLCYFFGADPADLVTRYYRLP